MKYMKRLLTPLVFLFPVLSAWSMPLPPISLEEVCARGELIVLGSLSDVKATPGKEACELRITAKIKVKEVLYGRPSAQELQLDLSRMGDDAPLERAEGELIWCLTKQQNGTWSVSHLSGVMNVDQRPQVEKAVEKRLEPDVQTLMEDRIDFGGPSIGKSADDLNPTYAACERLAKAGPASAPAARRLMAHGDPVHRAWGCRLAGWSGNETLVGMLASLLGDKAEVMSGDGCIENYVAVGAQALEALGRIAGKSFKTPEEAKAWSDSLKPKSAPPPAP